MHQKNLRYGTTRKVRRRPAEVKSGADILELKRSRKVSSAKEKQEKSETNDKVPSHWSSMPPEEQYKRVPLTAMSSEYKEVETLFKKTIKNNVAINSIERIQNPFMWEKYQRKKENMLMTKTGGYKRILNEKRLYHGTSPETVEAICKQNFDWRLHGKNATVYGEGSYFALNASYSDAYAKEDGNSSRFMFLAKVLVGSYTKGHSSYRRPPQKDPSNPASDLYDSCVDDISNSTIFVVFDTDQFYPEYIITYSTVSKATSANYSSRQPRTPALLKPPSSALGTPPKQSKSAAQSGHPASTVSSSIYSGLYNVNPTRSSNNLGTASNPSGSAAHRGYGTSTASSLGMRSANLTKSLNNLDTTSKLSGYAMQRSHSSDVLSSGPSVNHRKTAAHIDVHRANKKKKKKKKCVMM